MCKRWGDSRDGGNSCDAGGRTRTRVRRQDGYERVVKGLCACGGGGSDSERVGNRCQPKSAAAAAALLVSFVPEEINRTGNLSNANNALFLRFHRTRRRTPAVFNLSLDFVFLIFFFLSRSVLDFFPLENFATPSSNLCLLVSMMARDYP